LPPFFPRVFKPLPALLFCVPQWVFEGFYNPPLAAFVGWVNFPPTPRTNEQTPTGLFFFFPPPPGLGGETTPLWSFFFGFPTGAGGILAPNTPGAPKNKKEEFFLGGTPFFFFFCVGWGWSVHEVSSLTKTKTPLFFGGFTPWFLSFPHRYGAQYKPPKQAPTHLLWPFFFPVLCQWGAGCVFLFF